MITIKTDNIKRLTLGFLTGIVFGFLLQKGGVTHYEVIMKQLLLKDFTVIKIIVTAIITGMIGIFYLKYKNKINFHLKSGSWFSLIIGGLIFGAGFALLGYCPGTVAGAVGQGNLDALLGGITGIWLGSAFYARIFPRIQGQLKKGEFKNKTFFELFNIKSWKLVIISVLILSIFLIVVESFGL